MKKLWILLLLPFLMGANVQIDDVRLDDVSVRASYTDYCEDANIF